MRELGAFCGSGADAPACARPAFDADVSVRLECVIDQCGEGSSAAHHLHMACARVTAASTSWRTQKVVSNSCATTCAETIAQSSGTTLELHGLQTPVARAEKRSGRREKGRACLSEASLRGPRLTRASQVALLREQKGHGHWGRLSLLTFFGEAKKVSAPPGASPGSPIQPIADAGKSLFVPHWLYTHLPQQSACSRSMNASSLGHQVIATAHDDFVFRLNAVDVIASRFSHTCAARDAGAGMCARRRTHFLCFAKESKQRKATRLPVSLRSATGNLRCSRWTGSVQTRFAQTSTALFPSNTALLGTGKRDPNTGWFEASGTWFNGVQMVALRGLIARQHQAAHGAPACSLPADRRASVFAHTSTRCACSPTDSATVTSHIAQKTGGGMPIPGTDSVAPNFNRSRRMTPATPSPRQAQLAVQPTLIPAKP